MEWPPYGITSSEIVAALGAAGSSLAGWRWLRRGDRGRVYRWVLETIASRGLLDYERQNAAYWKRVALELMAERDRGGWSAGRSGVSAGNFPGSTTTPTPTKRRQRLARTSRPSSMRSPDETEADDAP